MKILGMGVPELLIILAVILLIFGPKNLRDGIGSGEKEIEEAVDQDEIVEEVAEEAPKKTVKKKVVVKKADE